MDRNLIPKSLRSRSFLPNLWDEMSRVGMQWMGYDEDAGVEVSEDENNVYVKADLPGLTDKDIDVSMHNNTLWIKGEKKEEETDKEKRFHRRSRNYFSYQVELPSQVEENSEQAEYQNGVLQITFRKASQANMKKINIRKTNSGK